MFFRGSRYEVVATAELTTRDGRVIQYKRVRFILTTEEALPYQTKQGDRLDLIAYQVYRDPEQFWRICDANLAVKPDELTEQPGKQLAVPIPMR